MRTHHPTRYAASLILPLAIAILPAACGEEGPTGPQDLERHEIALGDAPSLGRSDAPVTVVEFVDIQCPYCSVAARRWHQLFNNHSDDVHLVFKHYPLASHSRAVPAALAVECAREQNQFWPMLDALVADGASLDDQSIDDAASGLGLDMGAFRRCIGPEQARAHERINADIQQGKSLEIHATPTVFVNGLRIVGLSASLQMEAMVQNEKELALQDGGD